MQTEDPHCRAVQLARQRLGETSDSGLCDGKRGDVALLPVT